MHSFAERIHERLNDLNWNQAMLAKKTMMPPSMLSRLLKIDDEKLCRPQTLARISRALGVNAEWLITGSEPKLHVSQDSKVADFLEDDILSRLSAVVEAYAAYMEEKGYVVPPDMLAEGVRKLFLASIRERTFDRSELRKILTGERKTENPNEVQKLSDQLS